MVTALMPGTTYFENPDVTKKKIGADYSVARTPTQQEVERYPYFAGDTEFGSLDAWDIVPTVKKSHPKNVLFDVTEKSKKYEDIEKNRLTYNQFINNYDVPIGTYINTGLKYKEDSKGTPVVAGGSHTVRVVGYLPTGEPLVADYGTIRPLSQSMYTYGGGEDPFIAGITTVPGKEKYNFKYFKDQKDLANKPSNISYITDFSDKSGDYKKFHDTIAKNKNYVVANLGITPQQYDEYAKIALTLGGHETEFGKGFTYNWLDWLGESTGVAQLNESNVDEKYKNTLSKYKKGSKAYNALATVLYMNELNKYKDEWVKKGQSSQERPYKRHSIDNPAKELYRNLAQNKSSAGYINSAIDSDEFRDEKGVFEFPYKTPLQSEESYKEQVNKLLAKSRPDLRFDYDKSGERVVYKKTQGNKIPSTLRDFVFYAYNTPSTVRYGDAQGDSKYYQKMNQIYGNLFGKQESLAKKEEGGSVPMSSEGLYDYPQQTVDVPTSNGMITMQGIDYPVLGTDENGMQQVMQPGGEYQYSGQMVREVPLDDSVEGNPGKQVNEALAATSRYDNNTTYRDLVKNAAKAVGVDPRMLWSSSFVEGMGLLVTHPDQVSSAYNKAFDKDPKLQDYQIDGFYNYGLDNFGDVFPTLVKKGYLPKDFDYHTFKALNEQKKSVNTAAFKNNYDAIRAKAAYLRHEGDRVYQYADKLKLKLSPEEQSFFTMTAYNGGLGSAQAMLDALKKSGLSAEEYIKRGKTPKGQVYKNVKPRYDMMAELLDVFEAGGTVTTQQDKGQLKKLDQLTNFTNYNYYE
jgi:hypothetical protein